MAPPLRLVVASLLLASTPGRAVEVVARRARARGVQPVRLAVQPASAGVTLSPREQRLLETSPLAQAASELDLGSMSHMLFDVRNSRGGNGDVAASYLTAADLIARSREGRLKGPLPKLTFLADAAELKVLSRMTGTIVEHGARLFDGAVEVADLARLRELPPPDVYFSLAAPGGEFRRHGLLQRVRRSGDAAQGKIPLAVEGVVLTQTVLGNTEGHSHVPSTLYSLRHRYELNHAGVNDFESGVYGDPVARRLRDRSTEEIRDHILEALPEPPSPAQEALRSHLEGRALVGAELGLAYVGSMARVKPQFRGYLKGLAERAAEAGTSFLIATPSQAGPEDLEADPLLMESVVFLDPDAPLPAFAEKGKVYVLRTGPLSHEVFIGLLAYSRPTPLIAGDGSMSAALELGRPFVLAQVPWNTPNALAYMSRLIRHAPEAWIRERLVSAFVYDPNVPEKALAAAQGLVGLDNVFRAAALEIPILTDVFLGAIKAVRDVEAGRTPIGSLISRIDDALLASSAVVARAMRGDARAASLALPRLIQGEFDEKSRESMRALAHYAFRRFRSRVFGRLALAPPSGEPAARSRPADARTFMFVENKRLQPLRVFWIDESGARSYLHTIPPGGYADFNVRPGDVFVATDDGNRALALLTAGDKPGYATVHESTWRERAGYAALAVLGMASASREQRRNMALYSGFYSYIPLAAGLIAMFFPQLLFLTPAAAPGFVAAMLVMAALSLIPAVVVALRMLLEWTAARAAARNAAAAARAQEALASEESASAPD